MAQFITLDGMLLCSYHSSMLKDWNGYKIAEHLPEILEHIHKTTLFNLELGGRVADYFIKQCFPSHGYQPLFVLDVKEGDPKDKSTWVSMGKIGLCAVPLTPELAQSWRYRYDMPHKDDEPRIYLIPMALVEP